MPFKNLIYLLTVLLIARPAVAQGVAQCDAALVKATYSSFSRDKVDWRLATLVTEDQYDQAKHNGGLNAVIYGVPVGANYGDFKSRVNKASRQFSESLSTDQIRNVLWTGLDPNSPSAYSDCIRATVLTSAGLHIVPRFATATDITLTLHYIPHGFDPMTLNLEWSDRSGIIHSLPTHITAGTLNLIIPRPTQEQAIAVNATGTSDAIVLEPLPLPPPGPAYDISGQVLSGVYLNQIGRSVTYNSQDSCCTYHFSGLYTDPNTIIGVQTREDKTTHCTVSMPMTWVVTGTRTYCADEYVEPNPDGSTCSIPPSYHKHGCYSGYR